MKTPPPWTGGQMGYGETKRTFSRSGSAGNAMKRSRKYPPNGLRNASVSEIVASARARKREASAPGNWQNARHNPVRLGRSGESPKIRLKIAPANVKTKCEHRRGHSWMFFQQKRMKFFFRTRSIWPCENRL